jgi:A/G-specific adenine glycosylase
MFRKLIQWSRENYMHLPWRQERSLYRTLVSEIMLQQTTVGTVLNHFENFIKKYPNLSILASATEEDILIAWKGLGYYRRAKNLRNIAIEIENRFDGKIPTNENDLLSLKGVGKYTANALIAMGNDQRALAVDANIERVIARLYGYEELQGPKLQSKILEDFKAQKILKETYKLSSRDFNEALMDLGRVICQKKKSWCHICPLNNNCIANKSREPLSFPREQLLMLKKQFELRLLRIVVREKNKILFYQKNESEWLSGQWELPTFAFFSTDENFKQYPKLKKIKRYEELPFVKTTITNYVIYNHVLEIDLKDFLVLTKNISSEYIFKLCNDKLNLSTASIKSLKKVQN